jgi:hypothetical protein
MDQVFLFVALTAAGIINLLRSPHGMRKTLAYDVLGTDDVSHPAHPRASRYTFSLPVLVIVVGVARLIKAVGK